jgi:hypothetical protein
VVVALLGEEQPAVIRAKTMRIVKGGAANNRRRLLFGRVESGDAGSRLMAHPLD